MPASSREFVLRENASAGRDILRVVAETVSDSIAWANGGPVSTFRRTWLDTFDWRLYRAGLTLEEVIRPAGSELTLTGRDGEVLAGERRLSRSSEYARCCRWPGLPARSLSCERSMLTPRRLRGSPSTGWL